MMDLARQLRGFAGLYYEPSGDRLVIAMTESTAARFPEVRQLVSAKLTATGISPPLEYVEKVVEFSFIDLARHRAHLRPRLFAIPGAGTLEVDEVSNRIKIGLSDASAKMAVLDLATELAVPIDMIVFSKTHPIRFMDRSADDSYAHALDTDDPTLQDAVSIPDSTLRGGYQVHGNSRSNGQCTLGFVARRIVTSEPGDTLVDEFGFVTASHCSSIRNAVDNAPWGQPTQDKYVGVETVDAWNTSDASFVRFDKSISIKRASNFVGAQIGNPVSGSIVIDEENPVIRITGKVLDVPSDARVYKVGRASGKSNGWVSRTCVSTDHWPFCTHWVDQMEAGKGDSGAPIFLSDGKLVGILLGAEDPEEDDSGGLLPKIMIATMRQIETSLGTLEIAPRDWCGTP